MIEFLDDLIGHIEYYLSRSIHVWVVVFAIYFLIIAIRR